MRVIDKTTTARTNADIQNEHGILWRRWVNRTPLLIWKSEASFEFSDWKRFSDPLSNTIFTRHYQIHIILLLLLLLKCVLQPTGSHMVLWSCILLHVVALVLTVTANALFLSNSSDTHRDIYTG